MLLHSKTNYPTSTHQNISHLNWTKGKANGSGGNMEFHGNGFYHFYKKSQGSQTHTTSYHSSACQDMSKGRDCMFFKYNSNLQCCSQQVPRLMLVTYPNKVTISYFLTLFVKKETKKHKSKQCFGPT